MTVPSSTILLSSIKPVAAPELTKSLAQEIASLYGIPVQERQAENEPPAAGLSEIAVILIGTGAPLAYKFFEPTITAAGEAFRDKVLELLSQARKSRNSERKYVPLLIELGADPEHTPIRYFFYGRMDAADLLKRLKAADEHSRALPPELYATVPGPTENGFYWDRQEERWRGNVWGGAEGSAYGEYWIGVDQWDVGFENEDD